MNTDRLHKFNTLALPKFGKNEKKLTKNMLRAPCPYHQEVKIVLYSIWYHHTETSLMLPDAV
jgi:hypothetical protein